MEVFTLSQYTDHSNNFHGSRVNLLVKVEVVIKDNS